MKFIAIVSLLIVCSCSNPSTTPVRDNSRREVDPQQPCTRPGCVDLEQEKIDKLSALIQQTSDNCDLLRAQTKAQENQQDTVINQ